MDIRELKTQRNRLNKKIGKINKHSYGGKYLNEEELKEYNTFKNSHLELCRKIDSLEGRL